MATEEVGTRIEADTLNTVLILSVLVISIVYLLPLNLNSAIVLTVLAITGVLASFTYYQKVKQLESSTNTPFSDTLVVMGGVYLAIVLILPVLSIEPPSVLWSLLLIGTGIVGRLVILDLGLKILLESTNQLFQDLFGWLGSSALNFLRLITIIGAVVVYLLPIPALAGLQLTLALVLLTINFLLQLASGYQPPLALRVIAGFIAVFEILRGGLLALDSVELEALALAVNGLALLVWVVTPSGFVIFGQMLSDWVRGSLTNIIPTMKHILVSMRENWVTSLRLLLLTLGFVLLISGIYLDNNQLLMFSPIIAILSMGDYLLRWSYNLLYSIYRIFRSFVTSIFSFVTSNPVETVQLLLFLGAGLALFLVPSDNRLNLWISGSLLFLSLSPSILPPLYRAVPSIWSTFTTNIRSMGRKISAFLRFTSTAFQEYPRQSLQVIALLSALPLYLLLPQTLVVSSLSVAELAALVALSVAILPSMLPWMWRRLPVLRYLLEQIIRMIYWPFRFPDTYLILLSAIGIYFSLFNPFSSRLLQAGVVIATTITLVSIRQFFILRKFDSLHKLIFSLLISFNLGRVFSIMAWILLPISIFGWFLPENYDTSAFRLGLGLLSVLLWNTAYAKRRQRLVKLGRGLFTGFYNIIRYSVEGVLRTMNHLVRWILSNLFVVGLILLSIVFFIFSIGLIFPGLINTVVIIFGDILDNRLVSWIIALFLAVMAVFTLQQAFARSERVETGGKN